MKEDFKLPLRIEKQYANALEHLVTETFAAAQLSGREIVDFLLSYTQGESYQTAANLLAKRFMYALLKNNSISWMNRAKQTKRNREIFLALKNEMNGPIGRYVQEQIDKNAYIIKSTPLDISKMLVKKIMEKQQQGLRPEQMIKEMLELAPNLTKQRVNLIARTEVSKASTALTRAQSYNLGLDWYVWKTSEDGRVRSSHKIMDNVLVRWDDPPSPELLKGEKNMGRYNAGEIYNCRCYAAPVIDFKYVNFPCRVYSNGAITKMNKTTFESKVA